MQPVTTTPRAFVQRFFDSDICGGAGCTTPGCGPRVSVAVCDEPAFIPDEDAGVEQGIELITYTELVPESDACGP